MTKIDPVSPFSYLREIKFTQIIDKNPPIKPPAPNAPHKSPSIKAPINSQDVWIHQIPTPEIPDDRPSIGVFDPPTLPEEPIPKKPATHTDDDGFLNFVV